MGKSMGAEVKEVNGDIVISLPKDFDISNVEELNNSIKASGIGVDFKNFNGDLLINLPEGFSVDFANHLSKNEILIVRDKKIANTNGKSSVTGGKEKRAEEKKLSVKAREDYPEMVDGKLLFHNKEVVQASILDLPKKSSVRLRKYTDFNPPVDLYDADYQGVPSDYCKIPLFTRIKAKELLGFAFIKEDWEVWYAKYAAKKRTYKKGDLLYVYIDKGGNILASPLVEGNWIFLEEAPVEDAYFTYKNGPFSLKKQKLK